MIATMPAYLYYFLSVFEDIRKACPHTQPGVAALATATPGCISGGSAYFWLSGVWRV